MINFSFRFLPDYLNCKIVPVPGAKILSTPAAMAFQKDSPYSKLFGYYMRKMRERGELRKLLNVPVNEVQQQDCPGQSGKPIGFDSCLAAFLILISGMTSGFVLICLELVCRPRNDNKAAANSFRDETFEILEGLSNRSSTIGEKAEIQRLTTLVTGIKINIISESKSEMKAL